MSFPFDIKDGWVELPKEVLNRIRMAGRGRDFWYAVGRGDMKTAIPMLYEAGVIDAEDPDAEKEPAIQDLFVMDVPDEMVGELTRAWVKASKKFLVLEEE